MEMTREQEMQGNLDALVALTTAVAFQIDPIRLIADLRLLADLAEKRGHGPSAGLIDEMIHAVEIRVLGHKRN